VLTLGQLTKRHTEIFLHNPLFLDIRIPEIGKLLPLASKLPHVSPLAMHCIQQSLIYDPDQRATTTDLMRHAYFQHDQFAERYEVELRRIIDLEKEKEQSDRLRRRRNKKVLTRNSRIIRATLCLGKKIRKRGGQVLESNPS
jgi:cyclin-dependent kinase-like